MLDLDHYLAGIKLKENFEFESFYPENFMSATECPRLDQARLTDPDGEEYRQKFEQRAYTYMVQLLVNLVHEPTLDVPKVARILGKSEHWLLHSIVDKLPDGGFWLLLGLLNQYWFDPNRTVYVFQEDFFRKFVRLKLDNLQFRHLPTSMRGFVHLPFPLRDRDGELYQDVLFYVGPNREIEKNVSRTTDCLCGWFRGKAPLPTEDLFPGTVFYLIYFTQSRSMGFAKAVLPDDLTLPVKEGFANILLTLFSGPPHHKGEQRVEDGYSGEIALLFNMLAYLGNGQPDLREFRNTIRYRSAGSSKPVRADSHLSREKIVLVGYNYLKEQLKRDSAWYSSAHLGWRWCGPKRSVPRLVYVKDSMKRWHEDGTEREELDTES